MQNTSGQSSVTGPFFPFTLAGSGCPSNPVYKYTTYKHPSEFVSANFDSSFSINAAYDSVTVSLTTAQASSPWVVMLAGYDADSTEIDATCFFTAPAQSGSLGTCTDPCIAELQAPQQQTITVDIDTLSAAQTTLGSINTFSGCFVETGRRPIKYFLQPQNGSSSFASLIQIDQATNSIVTTSQLPQSMVGLQIDYNLVGKVSNSVQADAPLSIIFTGTPSIVSSTSSSLTVIPTNQESVCKITASPSNLEFSYLLNGSPNSKNKFKFETQFCDTLSYELQNISSDDFEVNWDSSSGVITIYSDSLSLAGSQETFDLKAVEVWSGISKSSTVTVLFQSVADQEFEPKGIKRTPELQEAPKDIDLIFLTANADIFVELPPRKNFQDSMRVRLNSADPFVEYISSRHALQINTIPLFQGNFPIEIILTSPEGKENTYTLNIQVSYMKDPMSPPDPTDIPVIYPEFGPYTLVINSISHSGLVQLNLDPQYQYDKTAIFEPWALVINIQSDSQGNALEDYDSFDFNLKELFDQGFSLQLNIENPSQVTNLWNLQVSMHKSLLSNRTTEADQQQRRLNSILRSDQSFPKLDEYVSASMNLYPLGSIIKSESLGKFLKVVEIILITTLILHIGIGAFMGLRTTYIWIMLHFLQISSFCILFDVNLPWNIHQTLLMFLDYGFFQVLNFVNIKSMSEPSTRYISYNSRVIHAGLFIVDNPYGLVFFMWPFVAFFFVATASWIVLKMIWYIGSSEYEQVSESSQSLSKDKWRYRTLIMRLISESYLKLTFGFLFHLNGMTRVDGRGTSSSVTILITCVVIFILVFPVITVLKGMGSTRFKRAVRMLSDGLRDNVKEDTNARLIVLLHPFFFYLRRLLLVMAFFFKQPMQQVFLLLLQTSMSLYLISFKPFKERLANLIEVLNESVIFSLLCLHQSSELSPDFGKSHMYTGWLIVALTLIVLSVNLVACWIQFIHQVGLWMRKQITKCQRRIKKRELIRKVALNPLETIKEEAEEFKEQEGSDLEQQIQGYSQDETYFLQQTQVVGFHNESQAMMIDSEKQENDEKYHSEQDFRTKGAQATLLIKEESDHREAVDINNLDVPEPSDDENVVEDHEVVSENNEDPNVKSGECLVISESLEGDNAVQPEEVTSLREDSQEKQVPDLKEEQKSVTPAVIKGSNCDNSPSGEGLVRRDSQQETRASMIPQSQDESSFQDQIQQNSLLLQKAHQRTKSQQASARDIAKDFLKINKSQVLQQSRQKNIGYERENRPVQIRFSASSDNLDEDFSNNKRLRPNATTGLMNFKSSFDKSDQRKLSLESLREIEQQLGFKGQRRSRSNGSESLSDNLLARSAEREINLKGYALSQYLANKALEDNSHRLSSMERLKAIEFKTKYANKSFKRLVKQAKESEKREFLEKCFTPSKNNRVSKNGHERSSSQRRRNQSKTSLEEAYGADEVAQSIRITNRRERGANNDEDGQELHNYANEFLEINHAAWWRKGVDFKEIGGGRSESPARAHMVQDQVLLGKSPVANPIELVPVKQKKNRFKRLSRDTRVNQSQKPGFFSNNLPQVYSIYKDTDIKFQGLAKGHDY